MLFAIKTIKCIRRSELNGLSLNREKFELWKKI